MASQSLPAPLQIQVTWGISFLQQRTWNERGSIESPAAFDEFAQNHHRGDDTLNFLMMIGTAQYWTRVGIAIASAALISFDAFHRRIRAARRAIFPR